MGTSFSLLYVSSSLSTKPSNPIHSVLHPIMQPLKGFIIKALSQLPLTIAPLNDNLLLIHNPSIPLTLATLVHRHLTHILTTQMPPP